MKEYILLYAPSIFCVLSAFIGFIKTSQKLKNNAKAIIESREYKNLSKEMKDLRAQISCQTQYNVELIKINKELLNRETIKENEKLKKEEDGAINN